MIDLRLPDGDTIKFQHRFPMLIAGSLLADLYCSMQRRTFAGDIRQDHNLSAELP